MAEGVAHHAEGEPDHAARHSAAGSPVPAPEHNHPRSASDEGFAPAAPPSGTAYRHARWPRIVQGSSGSGTSGGTSAGPRTGSGQASYHPALPARLPHRVLPEIADPVDPRRIVVVGVCSAGKSTLVSLLRERRYNARAVSQEHSYVPYLWRRSEPDVLVFLDASLHTIRQRGRPRWRQESLDEQHERLAHAREHCHLYISTDGLLPHDIAARVVTFLTNSKLERNGQ